MKDNKQHTKNSHPEFVVAPTLQIAVIQNRARVVLPAIDAGGSSSLSKIYKFEALTHLGRRQSSRGSVSKTELSVWSTSTDQGTQRDKKKCRQQLGCSGCCHAKRTTRRSMAW